MIVYTEDYKKRVLAVTNNNQQLRDLLDNGSRMVGIVLDDMAALRIDPAEIIDARNDKAKADALYNKALRMHEIDLLLDEWEQNYNSRAHHDYVQQQLLERK